VLGYSQPSPFDKLRAGSAGLNSEPAVLTQTVKPIVLASELYGEADELTESGLQAESGRIRRGGADTVHTTQNEPDLGNQTG
jgi:hypothetical protein